MKKLIKSLLLFSIVTSPVSLDIQSCSSIKYTKLPSDIKKWNWTYWGVFNSKLSIETVQEHSKDKDSYSFLFNPVVVDEKIGKKSEENDPSTYMKLDNYFDDVLFNYEIRAKDLTNGIIGFGKSDGKPDFKQTMVNIKKLFTITYKVDKIDVKSGESKDNAKSVHIDFNGPETPGYESLKLNFLVSISAKNIKNNYFTGNKGDYNPEEKGNPDMTSNSYAPIVLVYQF